MVYVGVSARVLVNVEALNMSESVGNVVRHKKAPVVTPVVRDGSVVTYSLRYVPVISGESIAHGYQSLIASLASLRGLPVCPLCKMETFVKHSSKEVVAELEKLGDPHAKKILELIGKKIDTLEKVHEIEKEIIKSCVVEDVGGFLLTDVPVKRTSRFYSGYMIPSLAYLDAAATETQFHVRHDVRPERGRQAIYYVETGSALYTLNIGLDVDGVGCTSAVRKEPLKDREERIKVAVEALAHLVASMGFGAKKTRFLPHWEIESMVVTISHPLPFNPRPAHHDDYIVETVRAVAAYNDLLKAVGGFAKAYYYTAPRSKAAIPEGEEARVRDPISAVMKALDYTERSKC